MIRFAALTLLIPSALFIACGDGDATCAPGTVLQNGQCVPAAGDTGGGQDTTPTQDTAPTPDTTPTQDTAPTPDTSPAPDVSGECETDEAGSRDFGAGCSKTCQCRTDLGGYCYSGPFLEGFSFCTRNGGLPGELNAEQYPTLLYNSACWDFPGGQWPVLLTKSCSTLDDCKELSAAYTHCGTNTIPGFPTGNTDGTMCPSLNGSGFTVMSSRRTCIIEDLPPFNRL